MTGTIEIKADEMEGGGQVLRSSISLATMLGKQIHLCNIRGNRPNPGMKAQHLSSVKALLEITKGNAEGAEKDSPELFFRPGKPISGNYSFDVVTAGSACLVAQAVLPVLAQAETGSTVSIKGGTHVNWAPNAHYLKHVFLPLASRFGLEVECEIPAFGWFPKGGGEITLKIGHSGFKPAKLDLAGEYKRATIYSCSSNLPDHVAERQADSAEKALAGLGVSGIKRVVERKPALSPGCAVTVVAESKTGILGGSALGEKGKKAEEVGREAVLAIANEITACVPIDPRAADQLLLYAALARGESRLLTTGKTGHLETNAWLIKQFIKASIEIEEKGGMVLITALNNGES